MNGLGASSRVRYLLSRATPMISDQGLLGPPKRRRLPKGDCPATYWRAKDSLPIKIATLLRGVAKQVDLERCGQNLVRVGPRMNALNRRQSPQKQSGGDQ